MEQLNLDYLASAVRAPSVLAGRASLSFTLKRARTHARSPRLPRRHVTSALAHFRRSDDVIKALMRDYSDITGNAAKLNLLASPCAFTCAAPSVKSGRPLGQVVHGVRSLLIHAVTPPRQCTSDAKVGPRRKKDSDVGADRPSKRSAVQHKAA